MRRRVTQPAVGQTVHYRPAVIGDVPVTKCLAGIITEVADPAGEAGGGIVHLHVFTPEGGYEKHGVSYVLPERSVGDTWHRPERVRG